ncbi:MAG: hypothetical protein A2161_09630, partial [Candidatus Schekmanbacteria bacterium RBG_13_48_7]
MNDNYYDIVPEHIGAQIRQLRLSKGLSLTELAQRAGTSAPALHRYESGWEKFEIATLKRITSALGARLDIRLVELQVPEKDETLSDTKLLDLISPLFWDKRITKSDLKNYPLWVVKRVLMYGSWQQVQSIRRHYGDNLLREAIFSRGLDAKTKNFWKLLMGIENDAPESIKQSGMASAK